MLSQNTTLHFFSLFLIQSWYVMFCRTPDHGCSNVASCAATVKQIHGWDVYMHVIARPRISVEDRGALSLADTWGLERSASLLRPLPVDWSRVQASSGWRLLFFLSPEKKRQCGLQSPVIGTLHTRIERVSVLQLCVMSAALGGQWWSVCFPSASGIRTKAELNNPQWELSS